jgi:ABC-type glycerol-3-phosphate transport system permease component
MMAGAVVTTLPVVVVFLLLQRHYIEGLAAGALKE